MARGPYLTIMEEIEQATRERYDRIDAAVKPLLEPAVAEATFDVAGPLSLAISMKRIADFICGSSGATARMDVVAYIGREIDDVLKRR